MDSFSQVCEWSKFLFKLNTSCLPVFQIFQDIKSRKQMVNIFKMASSLNFIEDKKNYCIFQHIKHTLKKSTVFNQVLCNFLRPKLKPFAAGNCRCTSWFRPSPWPTISTHKICISCMVWPNIWLQFKSWKVTIHKYTWYVNITQCPMCQYYEAQNRQLWGLDE